MSSNVLLLDNVGKMRGTATNFSPLLLDHTQVHKCIYKGDKAYNMGGRSTTSSVNGEYRNTEGRVWVEVNGGENTRG